MFNGVGKIKNEYLFSLLKLTGSYFSLLASFSYLGTKVLHQCLIGKRAVFFI